MKTLKSLIESKKFDYVNSDITEKNFPPPKTLRSEYKLYNFDRDMSSEEIIKEIEKDGYSPANIYELLSWKEWNGKNLIVALGSVAYVNDDRNVAYLRRGGSLRCLYLNWFDDGWHCHYRFLAVRNSDLGLSESVSLPSDPSSLDLAIQKVKEAGYVIYKQM